MSTTEQDKPFDNVQLRSTSLTDIRRKNPHARLLVGKPGPGSLSEALACGLAVIVVRNLWTLPQERFNAEWMQDRQFGIMLRSFSDINNGISNLLSRYDEFKEAVAAYHNRAIFEIPDILQQILAQSPGVAASIATA